MNKHKKWEKIMDEYFNNVTTEQFVKDSADVGIKLVPRKRMATGIKSGIVHRSARKHPTRRTAARKVVARYKSATIKK